MKNIARLLLVLSLALAVGCTKSEEPASSTPPDADNTARNTDQKSPDALAAADQGETDEDIRITSSIRQSVIRDKSLSTNAQNIKIITSAGKVTLRGPVKTEHEKSKIEAYAKLVNGVDSVDNMLEVEKNPQ